jgi:hypothetical protein
MNKVYKKNYMVMKEKNIEKLLSDRVEKILKNLKEEE